MLIFLGRACGCMIALWFMAYCVLSLTLSRSLARLGNGNARKYGVRKTAKPSISMDFSWPEWMWKMKSLLHHSVFALAHCASVPFPVAHRHVVYIQFNYDSETRSSHRIVTGRQQAWKMAWEKPSSVQRARERENSLNNRTLIDLSSSSENVFDWNFNSIDWLHKQWNGWIHRGCFSLVLWKWNIILSSELKKNGGFSASNRNVDIESCYSQVFVGLL